MHAGEVVAVDGLVLAGGGTSTVGADGEPLPVTVRGGGQVRSGTATAGGAFELRALRPRPERYAALVGWLSRPESSARPSCAWPIATPRSSSPGDCVDRRRRLGGLRRPVRALAVFVMATPCPLILAAPIALMSGLSRAARAGIVVKGAGGGAPWQGAPRCCSTRPAPLPSVRPKPPTSPPSISMPVEERFASPPRSTSSPPSARGRRCVSGAEQRGLEAVRFPRALGWLRPRHRGRRRRAPVLVGSAAGCPPAASLSASRRSMKRAKVYVAINGASGSSSSSMTRFEDAALLVPGCAGLASSTPRSSPVDSWPSPARRGEQHRAHLHGERGAEARDRRALQAQRPAQCGHGRRWHQRRAHARARRRRHHDGHDRRHRLLRDGRRRRPRRAARRPGRRRRPHRQNGVRRSRARAFCFRSFSLVAIGSPPPLPLAGDRGLAPGSDRRRRHPERPAAPSAADPEVGGVRRDEAATPIQAIRRTTAKPSNVRASGPLSHRRLPSGDYPEETWTTIRTSHHRDRRRGCRRGHVRG